MGPQSIVCPIDFYEQSYVALAMANALASEIDATLYVVHVITPAVSESEPMRKEFEAACKDLLQLAIAMFVSEDVNTRSTIVGGDTADEIISLSHNVQAGVIIMGTGGKTGWERARDGSIADEVAHFSKCPVVAFSVSRTDKQGQSYDVFTDSYISLN